MKIQHTLLATAIAALLSNALWAAGSSSILSSTPAPQAAAATQGFSKPLSASAHALIMTIGEYQGSITKLKGVAYDSATASEIATRMGVPPANIVSLKDGELTLEGMRRALDSMESKLSGNDQLFVYYSGHGGRRLVQEAEGERCAESLITVDGQGFSDTEMELRLKRLSQKTQKTIVFIDACHSGGVTTRALGAAAPEYVAKSHTPAGQSCVKPTNILTRNLVLNKTAGSGAANFVHIAAARDSEVSLDQPGRGGVASQAWLACLAGAAKDTDGSGGLSAQEVQVCAQERINKQLSGAQGFLPHHVTITGNAGMVLSYAAQPGLSSATTPAAQAGSGFMGGLLASAAALLGGNAASSAPAPTGGSAVAAAAIAATPTPMPVAAQAQTQTPSQAQAPAPAIAPAAQATPVAAAPEKMSALAALNDIHNSRDDRRLVTISAPNTQLKIGRDKVDFTISSREGGHVYLLMAGSDGKTFDLLFPNQIDADNLVPPGGTLRLPRPSWALTAEGPPGKNTLLAIVSDTPRNFAGAGLQAAGPFSSANALAAKDIQLVTLGADAKPGDCSDPNATRNLALSKRCAAGYAAALITLEEVK